MILIAVIVGYILGVAPFIVPKIIEIRRNKIIETENNEEQKIQNDIFNEWLNGPQESSQVNQADIYTEYITGKVTPKGE